MRLAFESIKEQLLNEMARIGITDDSYEVWVRTDDPGKIPHFHYWDYSTKGKTFHACIRFDCPEYFNHTGKKDVLNKRQKKDLIKLLSSPYKRDPSKTMFTRALEEWNDNNSDVQIDENQKMPDYMRL